MKRILITGVAGFLGSHLAKELIADGCEVIGIDNFSTGREKNLEGITSEANFRLIRMDVASNEILSFGRTTHVEEIYHLASPASPKFYQKMPLATIEANTIGLKHMLELTRKNRAKLVYTSTSEVYGDPEMHPQFEQYRGNVNTWGPRACYDEAKRLGEVYCYEYYHRFNVDVRVARLFNTYSAGLRNDDGRVISNFVTQALTGQDITVYGDGTQSRSFCYVDDTIRALRLLMDRDVAGEIVNIGNPKQYSILEVAVLVKRLTDSKSEIAFHPLPTDDPKQRCPDITKAREILNWQPEIGLEEGLRLTIEAVKQSMFEEERT